MSSISLDVLAKLREFDTPTVCNVIELFEIRQQTDGYMDSRIGACFPELAPMVGFAATATFRASAGGREGAAYGSLEEQVEKFGELPGPPVVVFQDMDDPSVAATFGEVMCTIYRGAGAQGLITSGTGRDLDQVRALDFPAFTGGTCCSHGYPRIVDVHVPVSVGGILVQPGDLLHGDRNGVTTVPVEIAADVADACVDFVAAEEHVLGYARGGGVTAAGLADARAACDDAVAKLKGRVRG